MNHHISIMLFATHLVLWCCGFIMGAHLTAEKIESNDYQGYHCQPIQKVETLEEAKARIKQYQDKVRG